MSGWQRCPGLVHPVPEAGEAEGVLGVLGPRQDVGDVVLGAELLQERHNRLVGPLRWSQDGSSQARGTMCCVKHCSSKKKNTNCGICATYRMMMSKNFRLCHTS